MWAAQGSVLVELVVVLLLLSAAFGGYRAWFAQAQHGASVVASGGTPTACLDMVLRVALQDAMRHGQQGYLDAVLPSPPRGTAAPVICYE